VTVLALDTATRYLAVALGDADGVAGEVRLDAHQRHAELLAPAIATLCEHTGVRIDALAAVAVGRGPGLYSGLRVGITTARMLAQVLGSPVVGIGSPDLVAFPLRHTHRQIVVALPARRRELFCGWYRPVPGGVARDGEYRIVGPDELAAELVATREEILVAGPGAAAHREVLDGLDHVELAGPDQHLPSAAALVELALGRLEREEFCTAAELEPLYLRPSDAELAPGGPVAPGPGEGGTGDGG